MCVHPLSVHRISKVEGYTQGYKNSSIVETTKERVAYLLRRIHWHHEEIEDMTRELDSLAPDMEKIHE
jgi:hypothetical protein